MCFRRRRIRLEVRRRHHSTYVWQKLIQARPRRSKGLGGIRAEEMASRGIVAAGYVTRWLTDVNANIEGTVTRW